MRKDGLMQKPSFLIEKVGNLLQQHTTFLIPIKHLSLYRNKYTILVTRNYHCHFSSHKKHFDCPDAVFLNSNQCLVCLIWYMCFYMQPILVSTLHHDKYKTISNLFKFYFKSGKCTNGILA